MKITKGQTKRKVFPESRNPETSPKMDSPEYPEDAKLLSCGFVLAKNNLRD